jgi:uncharacterized protein (DUF433 family)
VDGEAPAVNEPFFGTPHLAKPGTAEYAWNMTDWSDCPAVERHPQVVSGAWVFKGTRVPVRALFENLRDHATVEEFLEWFPGVAREQVDAVLDHEARDLTVAALA